MTHSLDSVRLVNQLVIRARLHQSESLASSYGLQLAVCIKVSIPYSIIPLPASPDLTLPLVPDHNLRLTRSSVFPLSRRSPTSKPTLLASNPLSPEAQLAAAALNLSKSFRLSNPKLPQPQHQAPSIRVVVRNFTISLVVPPAFLPSLNPPNGIDPRSPVAEYAIVLDCLSQWSTAAPDWPFSVILPTPPCLKNSFRMLLPVGSTENPPLHLNTFPTLRRERSRFCTLRNSILSSTQSSVLSDDDLRPLSDESEPEGIGSLPDDDDESNHEPCAYWPQDELAPRIEGVFQSTDQLCIVLGSNPPLEISPLANPITAKRASTRLSLSVLRPANRPDSESHSVSVDLQFHVDLEQISTQSTSSRTPLVLTIPQQVADQTISARWSPLNTEGVIQTSFPTPPRGKEVTSSLVTHDELTPSSSPTSLDFTFLPKLDSTIPDLELLHTAAPFSELESQVQADSIPTESHLKFDDMVQPDEKLESVTPYQVVVWFDTEWLIRSAANSHNQSNSRLALNLHAQLDLALSSSPTSGESPVNTFPIPFFVLPSVDEQICACQISTTPTSSRQKVQLDLPPWASSIGTSSSSDQLSHQLQLCLNKSTQIQTMDHVIKAHLHQSECVDGKGEMTPEKKVNQPPTAFQPPLAESSLSIGTLIISPAGRIRNHTRRPTISNLSLTKKRHRHSLSMKNHSSKIMTSVDEKQTGPSKPAPRTTASIRSVQLDLVIDPSARHDTQYGELAITLCRPVNMMVDPWVDVAFRPRPGEMVEMLGVWIGDRELIKDEGFTQGDCMQLDEGSGETCRLVTIRFHVTHDCFSGKLDQDLPILRMIYKSRYSTSQFEIEPLDSSPEPDEMNAKAKKSCLLPWFHSSVGTYKVSLRTCVAFQLDIDQSTLLTLENSSNVTELIGYSMPPRTINQVSVFLKPSPCVSRVETLESSSSSALSDEGQTRESEKGLIDYKTIVEGDVDRLSWPEYYTSKFGLNFKTLLLCWLIYLVSFMSIQLDEMGARLDVLNQQQSQPLITTTHSSCSIPYKPTGTLSQVKKEDSFSKDQSFGNTVKPFLSKMMINAFKPSSVIHDPDILKTDHQNDDDDQEQLVLSIPDDSSSLIKKEEGIYTTNKNKNKPDDEFDPFLPLSEDGFPLDSDSVSHSNSDPDSDRHSSNSSGGNHAKKNDDLNNDFYWFAFLYRLFPNSSSFFFPFNKIIQKIPFF